MEAMVTRFLHVCDVVNYTSLHIIIVCILKFLYIISINAKQSLGMFLDKTLHTYIVHPHVDTNGYSSFYKTRWIVLQGGLRINTHKIAKMFLKENVN